ncbi:MAG: HU family DNA-binding protein [Planctomycetes bacterium]|nr:HU family DNA-binding protein [Planctomycetota bacterium]
MNKAQLVDALHKDKSLGLESRARAERVANAVVDTICQGIQKDKSVQIIGFGTFTVRTRKARKGRNPRTGETIKIKASKTVGFRPGRGLRDML